MALNKGWDRHFFITSTMTSGGSLNVAKGQFAVVNNHAEPTRNGRKVISSFDGLSKDTELVILQGVAKPGEPRSSSNKPWSTKPFKISEIQDLQVGTPTSDFKVDEFVIGYNGFDEETALTFENGDNEVLHVTLSGKPIGMAGYQESKVDFNLQFGAPNEGDFTNQEIVEEAVKRMRRYTLLGGVPITEYIDIDVINSENPETITGGTENVFYNLRVTDGGDSLGLAAVQSQYPDHKVVKTDRIGGDSVYTIMAPTGTTLEDFSYFKSSVLKGCAECPAGYSEIEGGVVYSVSIADGGEDSTAAVQGISTNAEAGSARLLGVDEHGVSQYSVVVSEKLTEDELDTFAEENPTSSVKLAAEDVQALCSPDNQQTVSWTTGESCTAITETYTMVVGDDECGEPRTEEIQAFYPELEITEEESAHCATKYSTTVTTNVVCEECDPAFRDLFESEAPVNFKEFQWKKEEREYSETALMGIRLRGKKFHISGSEAVRDYMPFASTSTKISVSGGEWQSQTASYKEGSGERFHVEMRSRATEPEMLGGNIQHLEEASRRYFEGESRQYQNAFGTWVKGEESLIDPDKQYVDYILKVRIKTLSQSLSGELNETLNYHFITELGKHQEVEDILNNLASRAGVKAVQAFGRE